MINQLLKDALTCQLPRPRYAYLAPFRNQAKTVAWDYLKHFSAPIPGAIANESELRVDTPNGGRVTLYGCDKPNALRGIYLDGAVLDENAQMPPTLFGEVLRPALSDRQGYAVFIGTPMGRNDFYDLWLMAQNDPEWYAGMYRASETGILSDAELNDARKVMTTEQYAQEYECSFDASIVGAYYGALIEQAEQEGRITSVPYDPALPVDTSWDIGVDDCTSIWFWQGVPGGEVHCIDHLEHNNKGVEWYLAELAHKPYRYGTDYVPHDMEARSFVAGNRTPAGIARAVGRRLNVIERMNPLDRIQATRLLLPRVWFDKDKCKDGLEALRQYRKEFDAKRNTYKETPYHDWTSHAADSAGHYAVGFRGVQASHRQLEINPPYYGEA
jgi:hypothetical protein